MKKQDTSDKNSLWIAGLFIVTGLCLSACGVRSHTEANKLTKQRMETPTKIEARDGFLWIYGPANLDNINANTNLEEFDRPIVIAPGQIIEVGVWDGKYTWLCGCGSIRQKQPGISLTMSNFVLADKKDL